MYADTDFWVALLKDDDWLAERAEQRLAEHSGDIRVSLATFIELFLIEERYSFNRDQAVLSVLELAETDIDPDVVFQASEFVEEGLNTFDAFHAAHAVDGILSSDKAFDEIDIERVRLEPGT